MKIGMQKIINASHDGESYRNRNICQIMIENMTQLGVFFFFFKNHMVQPYSDWLNGKDSLRLLTRL